MSQNKLHLRLLTPHEVVYEDEVDSVILRCMDGDRGILPGHTPSAVTLGYGSMRIFKEQEQTGVFAVLGGFAVVEGDRLTVLSEMAGLPEKIDEAKIVKARDLAEKKLQERHSENEIQRAETALRRALVQMDVSSYSITKGKNDQTL